MKKILFLTLCFLFPVLLWAQKNWKDISSVEEACAAWPQQINAIFQNLDLGRPGLESVRQAYEKGDQAKACRLLLDYYESSPNRRIYRKEQPAVTGAIDSRGDSILRDIFTFQQVTGSVPRLPDRHLDWNCTGPENDIEWAWALNRHYPINDLLAVWDKTGNPVYVRYADQFIRDWIIKSQPYPGVKSNTAMWRGLEVSFRVKTWAKYFYQFMGTGYLSPATRLLILSSLPDHAHYARNFHAQGNWLTMEMSGLATLATAWPEFKESKNWLDYTIGTMTASMKEQVYPDGVQTELTSSYHQVALSNFELFNSICKNAEVSLPAYFTETIASMWNYLAWTIRPDGYGVLNNDGDLTFNRGRLLKVAEELKRDDWKYIVSNGKQGKEPQTGPSVFFPWAGQLVSRSGFDEDAQWSFFDIGPWGTGHQHNDKLHLSVFAHGRDLLVDAGRFAYRGEVAKKFRGYALGSQGHNVILIDHKGQAPGPLRATEPVTESACQISPRHDIARGSFDRFNDLEGTARHTRTLYYERNKFWIVVDQIETDRPRTIEALWHWHPGCRVLTEGQKVFTMNDKGNLQIIPAGQQSWKITLVKGQETPEIQGWYSREYNIYEPAPATVYSTNIERSSTFVWLLYPTSGRPDPDTRIEVLSQTSSAIKVKITSQKEEGFLSIPLLPDR